MTDDERAIRDLIQTWMDASRAGDTAIVLSLMTDDAVFMVPGRDPFGKDTFAKMSAQQQDMKIDGTSDIRELKVLGDWAYLRNYLEVTITPKGAKSVTHAGYVLTILRKENGTWRLARDANLLTPKTN